MSVHLVHPVVSSGADNNYSIVLDQLCWSVPQFVFECLHCLARRAFENLLSQSRTLPRVKSEWY
jgi:hypothetical protein